MWILVVQMSSIVYRLYTVKVISKVLSK